MKEKKVTFADIAKYTGFSKTTISRYFNSPEYLTPDNRKIIADALDTLQYQENKVARSLANGRTEFIGILIPNLYMQFYSEVLHEMLSTYEKYGYKFLVFTGDKDKEIEKKYLKELLSYNIEGLVVLSHTIPSEELLQFDIPIVTIEREDEYVSSVNTDNFLGGVQATTLLLQSNCEVLIHVNNDLTPTFPAYGRIQGFLAVCRQNEVEHELITTTMGDTYTENEGLIIQLINELNRKYPDKKKGLFMSNDVNAGIMVNILVQRYGRIPDDYRVVGFDDVSISREAVVPISTVGQQTDVMVREVIEMLTDQIRERKEKGGTYRHAPMHKIIPPILVRRKTTD